MENARFLECLAADEARLREVGGRDLTAPVPSCPEWTVRDLVEHVAVVYLHKVECMRRLASPDPWPPDVSGEEPVALLDRAYAALAGEFAARAPESKSFTWYGPDQTVGFWVRRMAQETVIHRVDAELALGEAIAPIPDDLALDGIDEVLVRFLAFGTQGWPEEFGDLLSSSDGSGVLVSTGGRGWLVRPAPGGVSVEPAAPGSEGAATVSGDPQTVLLWLWRRVGADAVRRDGDGKLVDRLTDLLGPATQ
jgi:uncharacterized protein (TIGR03083 family)